MGEAMCLWGAQETQIHRVQWTLGTSGWEGTFFLKSFSSLLSFSCHKKKRTQSLAPVSRASPAPMQFSYLCQLHGPGSRRQNDLQLHPFHSFINTGLTAR